MQKFEEVYEHIATLRDRVVELENEVTRLESASITKFMNSACIPDKDKERIVDLYYSFWCPTTRCHECIFGATEVNCLNRDHIEAILYGKELPNDEHKEEESQKISENE